jgi:hypothetical protein
METKIKAVRCFSRRNSSVPVIVSDLINPYSIEVVNATSNDDFHRYTDRQYSVRENTVKQRTSDRRHYVNILFHLHG